MNPGGVEEIEHLRRPFISIRPKRPVPEVCEVSSAAKLRQADVESGSGVRVCYYQSVPHIETPPVTQTNCPVRFCPRSRTGRPGTALEQDNQLLGTRRPVRPEREARKNAGLRYRE